MSIVLPENLNQVRKYLESSLSSSIPESLPKEPSVSIKTPKFEPATKSFDFGNFADRIAAASSRAFPSADGYSRGINRGPYVKPENKEKKKHDSSNDEGGLLKLIISILKIPMKFDMIFEGITSAGLALSLGLEGAVKSTFLGVEDLVALFTFLVSFFMKYLNCIVSFFVNLPACFVAHIITCVASVLYLIFPLTAFIFKFGTGIDLMPMFESAFKRISDGDDMMAGYIGFHFTKFPPAIIKKCYTCNNKVIKVNDILTDAAKLKTVGDKVAYDMTKKVPDYMRPAMPHIKRTGKIVEKVFQ
jgi:hypothetical protein